jgi:hypothetical protein
MLTTSESRFTGTCATLAFACLGFGACLCLLLTGCGLFQPVNQEKVILVEQGQPGRIVSGQVDYLPDGVSEPVTQNVSGWIVMDQRHFDELMESCQ